MKQELEEYIRQCETSQKNQITQAKQDANENYNHTRRNLGKMRSRRCWPPDSADTLFMCFVHDRNSMRTH